MISQFRTILSVKQLREDRALAAMQAARGDVRKAEDRVRAAEDAVAESAATLTERERAIFAAVLGQVVGLDDVDIAKDKARQLAEDHQKLVDKVGRAKDHLARMEQALTEARAGYRSAQAATEKITTITDELVSDAAADAIAAEEAEIEDLFARPRKRIGDAA